MSEQKIISKECTLYRAEGSPGRWFFTESDARAAATPPTYCTCEGCPNIVKPFRAYCDACEERMWREKHAKRRAEAPEWDGSYPVFLGDTTFCNDEEELLTALENEPEQLNDEVVEMTTASAVLASGSLTRHRLEDMVLDDMNVEDPEIPAELVEMIREFCAKVEGYKTPLAWSADTLIRMGQADKERFKQEIMK